MPQTLEVIAKLHKFSPANLKLRSYIVECYIEYGYPEKAIAYFIDNKDSFDMRAMYTILSSLYSSALTQDDEKVVLFILDEYKKLFMSKNHSPGSIPSFMRIKSRYLNYLLKKKKDPERVILVGNKDLEWFEKQTEIEANSSYFSRVNMRNVEGYKQYLFLIIFASSKYSHLFYISQAEIQLKKKSNRIPDILAICESLPKAEISYSSSFYRYYQTYYGYYYVSQLYQKMGDKENAKKYQDLGAKYRKQYYEEAKKAREAREELRKKAAEEAKKKAEEAKKKANEQKEEDDKK